MTAQSYSPKIILINGAPVPYIQGSLKHKIGYAEEKVEAMVSGRTPVPISSEDFTKAVSEVSFEIYNLDSNGSDDVKTMIDVWKRSGNANSIKIIPEDSDPGKPISYEQMKLTNDVQFEEMPSGKVSLVWQGKQGII
jgi:hypothetical protein